MRSWGSLSVVGLVCLGGVLFADSASACGMLRDWTQAYREATSDERRVFALNDIASVCGDYDTRRDDDELSKILIDAIDRNLPREPVRRVFDTYRCLPSLRATPAYAKLSTLDMSRCPTEAELAAWQVVAKSDVRVRAQASTSAPVVTLLKKGNVVSERGRSGEWVQVETWQGATGFIHQSLLEPF